ncbi:Zn-dependent protease [Cohnella faecalis]|uniref:Zn-dependent protease n=2 Tax=Cohnella faecalis TaxID=2315694 RepID=A0A398CLR8_9BACL|nr:Zn-dependent protease [Cohnella faecalis]
MLASLLTGRFVELVTLFFIVLFHELGHLAMALRFGWTVREVKLLPFGGVVEVEEAGSVPAREELAVALAGPAQNVFLAGVGWALGHLGWVDSLWAEHFVRANVLIGLFNFLPILPLDGGRIAQAWISLRVPYHRTLLWSARISLLFSVLVVLYAVYPLLRGDLLQLNLLAVGLFLCFSNWTYLRNVPFVFLRFLVHRNRRSEVRFDQGTLARPIVIGDDGSLSLVVRLFMKESYHLVYVMKQGRIANVVPEKTVLDRFLGRLSSGNADLRFFM